MANTRNLEQLTSREFELRVAQITELLEIGGATVTWNARVPDPDNVEQSRQIDVLVVRDQKMTLVECRHHNRPQDVSWVEELYGRKASLNASQIIGVSSSGFTAGAVAKAGRLGIFLRNLQEVSDTEAKAWGIRANVVLEYIALSDINVYLVTTDRIAVPVNEKLLLSAFTKADGSDWPLQDVLSRVARMLPDSGVREGRIAISIGDPLELFLGSVPVKELLLEFNWQRVRREQALPILFNYTSATDLSESIGLAQASGHSRTAIVYSDDAVSSIVDVSVNSFSPCSFLSKIQVEFGREVQLHACGVIGLEKPNITDFAVCAFHAIPKHSRKYRQLKEATLAPGTSRRMSWNHPEGPT